MDDLRIIEKNVNGTWFRCRMEELMEGDIFRMFNDEQDLKHNVRVGDNNYIATADACFGINDEYPTAWGILAERHKE